MCIQRAIVKSVHHFREWKCVCVCEIGGWLGLGWGLERGGGGGGEGWGWGWGWGWGLIEGGGGIVSVCGRGYVGYSIQSW